VPPRIASFTGREAEFDQARCDAFPCTVTNFRAEL
jgi:hypothetical protein